MEIFSALPIISGKAAVFGMLGLAAFWYLTKRPTTSIFGAMLSAGASFLI
ncbi:hypothetical protein GF406_12085 [candidate division KSB1 bacterium]|nr:hypothetical protein [candidate division KSB1 bacterium]